MRDRNHRPGLTAFLILLILPACDILGPSSRFEVSLDATVYEIGSTAVMTIHNRSYGTVSLAHSNCVIWLEVRTPDGWEPAPILPMVCEERGPERISGMETRVFPLRIWADGTFVEGSVYRYLIPHSRGNKGRIAYSPEFTVLAR